MKFVTKFFKNFNKIKKQIIILFIFSAVIIPAQTANDTLALINDKVITTSEFLQSYKEKVAKYGLTDNGEIRIKYLMNLVNDELLIAEAKNKKLNKTDEAEKELKRIRIQELLNAYSEKHNSPQINITEDDLKDLFIKMNMKIKVSHLYAPTKEKADLIYKELINGKSFEELAKENFEDPVLRNNGGALGYITIDEMDPDFEKEAYSMRVGEISEPVKTVEGYSIIRVEDIKSNPLVTENEYLKAREKLKSFARKRAYEEISKEFTHNLSERLEIKYNDNLLSKIYRSIQQQNFDNYMENSSLISENDLSEIIVSSKFANWDLQTLINELTIVTEKQKKWIKTEENLKDFITGLINRNYILNEAEKENLNKTPSFHKKVEFNFDTYLLTTIENKLKKEIKISEDSVKNYYKNNINLFAEEPEICLSSILLNDKTLADSIKNLLNNGGNFENLAKEFSIQKQTALSGGTIGFFKKKDLENIADEVFLLKPGEWRGPFVEDGKYAFLKCIDYKEAQVKPFEKVKDEIENNLIALEWYKFRDQYTSSLREKIRCEFFPKKLNSLNLLTKID